MEANRILQRVLYMIWEQQDFEK